MSNAKTGLSRQTGHIQQNRKSVSDCDDNSNCKCEGKCTVCKCNNKGRLKTTLPKSVLITLVISIIFSFVCFGAMADEPDKAVRKPGLIIIAHGAPWPQWNKPVLGLEQAVISELGDDNPFGKIKVVLMEFAKPSVADGIKELEEAGCSKIIAVPLLIAPSSHSHWDIPALLGIYSDAKMEKELKNEGAEIVRSKLPITVTGTLAESDVIEKIMLKRAKELSSDPNNEAVVLLAHGDHYTPDLWDSFMKKTVTYICGKTGISCGDWVCVEMGQGYDKAASAIACAAESRKTVIVVGAYLSTGVDKLHTRWLKEFEAMAKSMPGLENPLKDLDIKLSAKGLLPDPMVAKWIAEVSKGECVRNHTKSN